MRTFTGPTGSGAWHRVWPQGGHLGPQGQRNSSDLDLVPGLKSHQSWLGPAASRGRARTPRAQAGRLSHCADGPEPAGLSQDTPGVWRAGSGSPVPVFPSGTSWVTLPLDPVVSYLLQPAVGPRASRGDSWEPPLPRTEDRWRPGGRQGLPEALRSDA